MSDRDIEQALDDLLAACFREGNEERGDVSAEVRALSVAITTEQAHLRARAERLRLVAVAAEYGATHNYCMEFAEAELAGIEPGDLADDLV